MSDDMISQEEIDALLNGGGVPSGDAPAAEEAPAAGAAPDSGAAAPPLDDPLSDMQKDALGEIGNISMGSAATTLSVLLGHKVSITTPTVSMATMSSIRENYPMPYLIDEVGYTVGIDGNN
ncbi:MAG: chemotaxis protein CheC, partial [Schwartzia sp.]|nr:chemotaxis protein CheC [Schwartzia sp. (in: firmicutes)]